MKLSELIKDVKILNYKNYDENLIIDNIAENSKIIKNNGLFFAIKGSNTNGINYINEAVKNGAKVIVCESGIELENIKKNKNKENNNKESEKKEGDNKEKNNKKITIIQNQQIENVYEKLGVCLLYVENVRKAMALISSNFYENAHKSMKIISVVGTNGKTSTSHILSHLLLTSGKKVGIIGTNGIYYNGKIFENDMTTPDTIMLHKTIFDMKKCGIEYVVIEVSAHAIYLEKMYNVQSICTIFTNFSQDHLDFFKTMENYKNVKMSYFNKDNTKLAIINIDDKVGKELYDKIDIKKISFGIKNPSDAFAINISMSLEGSEFVVNYLDDLISIKTDLTCLFNVYNILACITCAKLFKIKNSDIKLAMKTIKDVAGRFNLIKLGQNFNIILDYAHTPQSLENLLSSVKSLNKNKTITVFGCPGNRDELKRSIMGECAGKYSDYVILTTNNPQFENSIRIMRDIERGVMKTNCPYKLIDDKKGQFLLLLVWLVQNQM